MAASSSREVVAAVGMAAATRREAAAETAMGADYHEEEAMEMAAAKGREVEAREMEEAKSSWEAETATVAASQSRSPGKAKRPCHLRHSRSWCCPLGDCMQK